MEMGREERKKKNILWKRINFKRNFYMDEEVMLLYTFEGGLGGGMGSAIIAEFASGG